MNGFLRFCSVVGTLILVGMGLAVAVTAAIFVGMALTGINPYGGV